MTTADGTVTESPDAEGSGRVARRALLTGGAVVAGAVGAGAALAATAAPAKAVTGQPINQGVTNTATNANDPATEIAATSNSAPTPTLVLTNTGSTGTNQASPPLRITPAATSSLYLPSAGTVGGDMVATNEGNLWFTHNNPGGSPIPATVHTDATSNSFMPLSAPYRILDTRTAAGRAHILNASGNIDNGRVIAGRTIHIDLTLLVSFGDAVTANLSVLGPLGNGWALVWPGGTTRPTAASIAFSKGQSISNLTVSGIASYDGKTDTVAITTSTTTYLVLDVAGFYVANFGQVNNQYAAFSPSMSSQSAVRASQVRPAAP